MQPIYVSKQIGIAASSNALGSVSTAVPSVATINSSTQPLDTARRLIFSSTAADTSTLSVTFTGTQQGGGPLIEAVRGSTSGAGTSATTRSDFLTLSSVAVSSNANVPLLLGTSSAAGTPWQLGNWHVTPPSYAATVAVNSSQATVTWEFTLDDPTDTYNDPNLMVPPVFASTGIAAAVGSSGATLGSTPTLTFASIGFPIAAWRMTLTSSSSTYLVDATVLQAAIG